jgi:predicted MFS family arabinose efflux permease
LERRDLLSLLAFFTLTNVGESIFITALTPFLLSIGSSAFLGLSMAIMGGGMVLSGGIYASTGGIKRPENGVMLGTALSAISMIVLGVARSPTTIELLLLVYGLSIPIVNVSSQLIWQTEVPPEIQGRIFSTRRMIAWAMNPVAILVSIPLSASVFGPLLSARVGHSTLSAFWGNGQSGALALMISACGVTVFAIDLLALVLLDGLRIRRTAANPA